MARCRFILALALFCAAFSSSVLAKGTPDYLTIGGGGYDFDKDDVSRESVDYRLEYEWGVSLLPLITRNFNRIDPTFQIHPTVGIEGNTHGALYGNGGINMDVLFLRHGILTWGEAVGAFDTGNDPRPMGAILEFRSQLELGWRFSDNLRVTGFISHISNAHVLTDNPGAEIIGVYVHVPMTLLGKK